MPSCGHTYIDMFILRNYILPVRFKAFETIDIKDPNQRFRIGVLSNGIINLVHQPVSKHINDPGIKIRTLYPHIQYL